MKLHEIKQIKQQCLTDEDAIQRWLFRHVVEYDGNAEIMPDGTVNIKDSNGSGFNSVSFNTAGFMTLKVQFGKIDGSFSLRGYPSPLKSLTGLPKEITGSFDICGLPNNITSMEGGPQIIGYSYEVENSSITNLKGIPKYIKGSFSIASSRILASLEGGPTRVDGQLYNISNCTKILSLNGITRSIQGALDISKSGITSLVGISDLFDNLRTLIVDVDQIKDGGLGLLALRSFKEVKSHYGSNDKWQNIVNKYASKGEEGILECQSELIENGLEEFAQL